MVSRQLADIYAIASIYFIKGIIDAQRICNPCLVDRVIESDRLTLIQDTKEIEMTPSNYIKFVISDLSKHDLCALRGSLLFFENKALVKELCYLLDYLYKIGCQQAGEYEGKNMSNVLNGINHLSSNFLTPEGNATDYAWHDMIRKYLVKLHIEYHRFSSEELDRYIVAQTLNSKRIEEEKQSNAAREKFILSGGDVPGEGS